jgi:hypothetical protein
MKSGGRQPLPLPMRAAKGSQAYSTAFLRRDLVHGELCCRCELRNAKVVACGEELASRLMAHASSALKCRTRVLEERFVIGSAA